MRVPVGTFVSLTLNYEHRGVGIVLQRKQELSSRSQDVYQLLVSSQKDPMFVDVYRQAFVVLG